MHQRSHPSEYRGIGVCWVGWAAYGAPSTSWFHDMKCGLVGERVVVAQVPESHALSPAVPIRTYSTVRKRYWRRVPYAVRRTRMPVEVKEWRFVWLAGLSELASWAGYSGR